MKHSIRKQFVLIYGVAMICMILLCLVVNTLFLESFYTKEKQRVLSDAYEEISIYAKQDDFTSVKSGINIEHMASRYNLDILVLNSETKTVVSSVSDSRVLTDRLLGYLFNGPKGTKKILSNDNYTLQKSLDPRMRTEFIELWGTLSGSKLIYMRSPMEGIKDSVHISNRFLAYVGIVVLLLGLCFNYLLAKRVTMPILELSEVSEKMANFDFDIKYSRGGDDEIAQLGKNINQLSKNLEMKISELKTANNELKRDLEKRAEIDEMRKDFLSNVSHELKTPIALIQGYSEGLKDCVNSDSESRDYYCDVIIDEASKMNKLVRGLLELNRLEFGNSNVDMEHFDIVELVKNCVNSNNILLEQNNIKLSIECDSLAKKVWADEFKIEQVFTNYLSNAINHCKKEKIIRVRITEGDGSVKVSVFNTGDKIPEEAIPHLWTKFYKVDKARTREYGGSGIGLSIVKAVMDSLSQSYGVNNCEDGVEFWFELDADSGK